MLPNSKSPENLPIQEPQRQSLLLSSWGLGVGVGGGGVTVHQTQAPWEHFINFSLGLAHNVDIRHFICCLDLGLIWKDLITYIAKPPVFTSISNKGNSVLAGSRHWVLSWIILFKSLTSTVVIVIILFGRAVMIQMRKVSHTTLCNLLKNSWLILLWIRGKLNVETVSSCLNVKIMSYASFFHVPTKV